MLNDSTRRKLRELNLEEMIQLIDQQQKHAHTPVSYTHLTLPTILLV